MVMVILVTVPVMCCVVMCDQGVLCA